ncbi:hypothetical protein FSP39_016698 [Pinctada imbricata]|uniref:Sema domain-containing protein n=1 Tax=Pinctada imbricata TaxID=66713 RepID=A0AA89CB09_PINIB|nr:hypothetical protein FSP39_016698 [Pinctada imbricata]
MGHHPLYKSILAWTFCLLLSVCTSQDRFSPPYANRPVANLAYDSVTNSLFIGAKNAIFRTSTSLGQMEYAITGPVNDTLNGKPYKARTGFDNHNEILQVLEPGKKLLVCGTGSWGRCAVYNLTRLHQDLNPQTKLYLVTSELTFNQGFVLR